MLFLPTYSIVFGVAGGGSLLTVGIWKPHEKTLETAKTLNLLELVLIMLNQEWEAALKIKNSIERSARLREINKAAIDQLTKLAKEGK